MNASFAFQVRYRWLPLKKAPSQRGLATHANPTQWQFTGLPTPNPGTIRDRVNVPSQRGKPCHFGLPAQWQVMQGVLNPRPGTGLYMHRYYSVCRGRPLPLG